MLDVIHVGKKYGGVTAIKDLSFRLNKGEILGLLGENGAGKSTTISMISTLLRPDQGSITWDGKDIARYPGVMRSVLGLVPQEIALYESLTGYDNLLFWGKTHHLKKAQIVSELPAICQMVSFPTELLQKQVSGYSGGTKRKLNIMVALLHQPKLVIMDEPTVGIDLISREQISKGILRLKERGTAVIYVGHYMEEVERICDRILILNQGTCVFHDALENAKDKDGRQKTLEQLYMEFIP